VTKNNGTALIKSGKDYLSLPADSLNRIVNAYFDYKKTCIIEETRRAEIEAWREITVTSIKEYFDKVGNLIQNGHTERMTALSALSQLIKENASSLPPEMLLDITKEMVKVLTSDKTSESIKALRDSSLKIPTSRAKSLLDQDDIIDI